MDENKLKALAPELAKGLKTEADLNQFSRMLTKLTVETALNAELTDHLGYEKNAPKKGSNARNGYSSKTLLCDDGEIELNTPCCGHWFPSAQGNRPHGGRWRRRKNAAIRETRWRNIRMRGRFSAV